MRKRWLLPLSLVAVLALPAIAGPYELAFCPITSGRFLLIEGKLWLEVFKEDGRAVEKRREQVANPLDERSHEVLSKRGTVTVETHRDKKSSDLFIHWGTLKDGEQ
jgi:hypothetical protein